MAKLTLKYEASVIKEIPLRKPQVSVGRAPDNARPENGGSRPSVYESRPGFVLAGTSRDGVDPNSREATSSRLEFVVTFG